MPTNVGVVVVGVDGVVVGPTRRGKGIFHLRKGKYASALATPILVDLRKQIYSELTQDYPTERASSFIVFTLWGTPRVTKHPLNVSPT